MGVVEIRGENLGGEGWNPVRPNVALAIVRQKNQNRYHQRRFIGYTENASAACRPGLRQTRSQVELGGPLRSSKERKEWREKGRTRGLE